jgi:Uma2 family endonuclease
MSLIDAPFHRLSVEDVRQMVAVGVLSDDDRVELLDGVLVDVSPPGAEHSAIVSWLTGTSPARTVTGRFACRTCCSSTPASSYRI